MILTVAVGNTSIRLAAFAGRRIVLRRSAPSATAPATMLPDLTPTAIGVASVVPRLTGRWVRQLVRRYHVSPLVLKPATPTGLRYEYPRSQLGADRVCAAVGAFNRWHTNLIVIDFGTATTLNVVSAAGVFRGGLILPGIAALETLPARTTAVLPALRLRRPAALTGRSTKAALTAGLWHLLAGGLASAINACDRLTSQPPKLIVTGGAADRGRRLLPRAATLDRDLVLRGLADIVRLNCPDSNE